MLLLSAAQKAIAQTMDIPKEVQRNSDLSGVNREMDKRLAEYMNVAGDNKGELHKHYYEKLDQNWDKLNSRSDNLQSYYTTQSQLVEKLGFLAEFFEGSVSGDIIKNTQQGLKEEKDSSHDSQKEALYNLSGQLAENLKTELDLSGKPTTTEDKEKRNKGISNIIEAVNILNDEMQGIDKIQQRNIDVALKPLTSRSGLEEFADKELFKAYSGIIESGDVPLGKEYWDNMRMLSSISSETRSVAIESDLVRASQEQSKTSALDCLKESIDKSKDTRSR